MMQESAQQVLSEYEERKAKLQELEQHDIAPYPSHSMRSATVVGVSEDFATLEEHAQVVTICGRIRSKRSHGNLSFADVEDATGRIQIAISKKEVPDTYKAFVKLVDVGDFVQVSGAPFVTKAGQQTIMAREWTLLSKALRAMPTDHFGLKSEEARYRLRYVDVALNPALRALFVRRAQFWQVIRAFMTEKGFLEVETPTLEVTTGGAEARPFATHHNDFDLDVYLRISIGELWQKRLMVAGFEKVFEIGRAFRNEGSSPNHLQEFTNMEFYWAYADYRDGMRLVQELYRRIAREVYGTTTFTTRGLTFDLADTWREIDYVTEIKAQTGVDVMASSEEELRSTLDALHVVFDGTTRERMTDALWKHCRKNIAGPAFLVGHPVLMAPLAKRMADNPDKTERFQVLLGGAEVGNGYSELNDPLDQRARFEQQQKLIDAGDDEAMMPDWEFVEALEYGMPPTCGFGVGERLFAFLEDKSLREVTLFPLMKPRRSEDDTDV